MQKINFEKVAEAAQKIESLKLDERRLGYLISYPIYRDFFQFWPLNAKSDFVIRAAIVYSWMPRVLIFREEKLGIAISSLKSLVEKMDEPRKEVATDHIATALNGSYVGASKFLHFQYPDLFPMYDTNVYRHLNGIKDKKKQVYAEANKASCYKSYRISVDEIVARADFEQGILNPMNKYFRTRFQYEITPQRAVEFLIFETYGGENT